MLVVVTLGAGTISIINDAGRNGAGRDDAGRNDAGRVDVVVDLLGWYS